MNHIDLFSGIAGFALAAQWAGFRTVAFVEIDEYAQEVIKQNFDAYSYQAGLFQCASDGQSQEGMDKPSGYDALGFRPALYSDIRDFDGTAYRGAALLTGGFPCQPFSQAGKRRGTEDDRYLWPEMLRVISEARPRYIVAENVTGLLSLVEPGSLSQVETKEIELFQSDESYRVNSIIEGIHRRIIARIIQDLEEIGYDFPRLADGTPVVLCIPACAVDAKHRRDRVWIVGHAGRERLETGWNRSIETTHGKVVNGIAQCGSEDVADAASRRQQEQWQSEQSGRRILQPERCSRWQPEPDVGRSSDGLPRWLDRHHGKGMTHEENIRSIKTLRELWNSNVSQALWQAARGLDRVQQAEVLFSFVRQHAKGSDEARLLVEGAKASEEFLRGLRREATATRSSRQSKQGKQRSGEHSDALQMVSQLPAFDGAAAWPSYGWEDGLPRVATGVADRVSRLKGLGNAIVPQVAYEILRGIAELEKNQSCQK